MDTSKRTKRQTIQWTLANGQNTDNTMITSKRTKIQTMQWTLVNGQKRQTIQWTIVNGQKDKHHNGH
jgi:hypothetical protein